MENVQTMNGTVHTGRSYEIGGRTLYGPACRRYRVDQLHATYETDAPITCKRCLARKAAEEAAALDAWIDTELAVQQETDAARAARMERETIVGMWNVTRKEI